MSKFARQEQMPSKQEVAAMAFPLSFSPIFVLQVKQLLLQTNKKPAIQARWTVCFH